MDVIDLGLTVTLPEGNPYAGEWTLRLGECTGIDDLDIRRETGLTIFALFNALVQETGMGAIVATSIVWLVRRRDFAHFTWQDAARAIPWNTDFGIRDADDPATVQEVEEEAGKAPGSEQEPTA